MDTNRENTDSKLGPAAIVRELQHDIFIACAEACSVDRQLIEHVHDATPEQEHRMNYHIKDGSYLEQIVLQFDQKASVEQQDFFTRVIDTIRVKNHILRTRLVKHESAIYQVVLKDGTRWTTKGDLEVYLRENINTRMGYGSELCRYALLGDEHGQTFFIWTAESERTRLTTRRTLRSIFDDLQQACSDLRTFSRTDARMQFSELVAWQQSSDPAGAFHFWRSRYAFFEPVGYNFPNFRPLEFSTASDARVSRTLHVQGMRPNTSLLVIGHAAWALTIFEDCGTSDVNFISMSPARKSDLPGIENVMGPVSVRVPIRVMFDNNRTIGGLREIIESQLLSMVGVEHYAMRALRGEGFDWKSVTQGVFQWHPMRSDIFDRTIACHDKDASPATLRYRSDLSVPASHDHGFMLDVWEEDGYIRIHASWNSRMLEWGKVEHVIEKFATIFTLIMKGHGETVDEIMGRCKEVEGETIAFVESPSTLRGSSTEFEESSD